MALCIHCALNCADGSVVHSYGRLIPHEFPITDLQQISGPDGIGRINCTFSSGTAEFRPRDEQLMLQAGGVSQTRNENGDTATLVVNPTNVDSFRNILVYCTDFNTHLFYLVISSSRKYASVYKLNSTTSACLSHSQYLMLEGVYLFNYIYIIVLSI